MNFTLKRVASTLSAVYGVLIGPDGVPFTLTLERPWLNNQPNVSCIPNGRYACKRISSPHFGDVFEVTDVPGRTHILLHKGNFVADSEGCILVGERFNGHGIAESAVGFDEFMKKLEGVDEFDLEIVEA